jgi:xylono-1,5-lactonase
LADIEADLPDNRCNDGKCDAAGAFWLSTLNMAGTQATGWLHKFARGSCQRALGPFICTNGPAFSPDGATLYCADTVGRVVYSSVIDSDGEATGQRVFVRFEQPDWGYPDGMTCDREGCVWIAHWGGSRLSRFGPDGQLLDVIRLPVSQPTSCTFGGDSFQTLFITSASYGLNRPRGRDDLDGALFAVDLDVGGLPVSRYAG